MNTHVHADHVTGTGILKNLTNCKSVIAKISGAKADVLIKDGDKIDFGDQVGQIALNQQEISMFPGLNGMLIHCMVTPAAFCWLLF